VKGSLRNTEGGFAFQLKNTLGSGYAKAVGPLTVDGEDVPLDDSFFSHEGREVSFAQVDENNTFGLPLNRTIDISVRGRNLAPSAHKIGFSFTVPGFGKLGFDFTDEAG
jgi:hypothetical protein